MKNKKKNRASRLASSPVIAHLRAHAAGPSVHNVHLQYTWPLTVLQATYRALYVHLRQTLRICILHMQQVCLRCTLALRRRLLSGIRMHLA